MPGPPGRLAAENGFRATPGGGEMAGDASKTDGIHFPCERASFELSEPCDRALCTVRGVPGAVIYNGDLLVFSDQEVRLP